jgi:signal transduction histidine kinase
VLLGIGAVLTWAVSRRITRRMASLTGAAEALARGDYDARAEARGSDEVARLAESFNRMAGEISAAHRALERQSADARATAVELARSNDELRLAREAAESANRAKSDFLATMSHELRTPLNAIGGYTELIEMELRGPITDAQRRDLERIRLSQQHLLGLISAILDRSRIERGLVSYSPVAIALDSLLGGLDALLGPQAASKELELTHDAGDQRLAVRADREKLRQVLLNLLSNAIRCTQPGGRVTVSAQARDAARVEIRVEDTGIGIPPEKLEEIFEPFVQLDRSLSRVRDGIGLGLAISRDLARGMGGDLTVTSRVGVGSCFILTLPRAELADVDPTTISQETAVASRGLARTS